jgi:hypothetical protein
MPYLPFFAATVKQGIFIEYPEDYTSSITPGSRSLPFGMIYGYHHAISFRHPTFYQALLSWLDFDDFGTYFVVFCAISYEDIRNIVSGLTSDRMSIFDRYGFGCPF